MAAEERSEQDFDDIGNSEVSERLDVESQELSNVQENVIEYNAEIFIDLVKEEPCLWNTAFRSYKDQTKKKNAWTNISSKMGKDSK